MNYWMNLRSHGYSQTTKKSAKVLLGKGETTNINVNLARQEMPQRET